MEELVKTFHIDWKLLIAQLINFGVVLGVLWYFALKPILKAMNSRREEIETGLKNAEKIKKDFEELEKKKESELAKTRHETQAMINEAAKTGEKLKEEMAAEAKKETAAMINEAGQEIGQAKAKMMKEVKEELAELVVMASSQVISRNLKKEDHQRLAEEALAEVADDNKGSN